MNSRLSLAQIATRLATVIANPSIKIGTFYDNDYLTTFTKVFPAIWVGAQRLTKMDDGMAFTQQNRQRVQIEVAIRLVVQRYIAGEVRGGPEARLNAICDATADALKDWMPAGVDTPFVWQSEQDGPPAESVLVVDAVFLTTATYARTS